VNPTNAFAGKTQQPSEPEVLAALGPSAPAWSEFIEWITATHAVTDQEWKSSSPKYGWSLRLVNKNRNIVYLAPCSGCFRVSLVLGSEGMDTARQSHLPNAVAHVLDAAPHFAEGWGIRLTVQSPTDLPPIETLAEIKLAN
jgi:hypothetical protein